MESAPEVRLEERTDCAPSGEEEASSAALLSARLEVASVRLSIGKPSSLPSTSCPQYRSARSLRACAFQTFLGWTKIAVVGTASFRYGLSRQVRQRHHCSVARDDMCVLLFPLSYDFLHVRELTSIASFGFCMDGCRLCGLKD